MARKRDVIYPITHFKIRPPAVNQNDQARSPATCTEMGNELKNDVSIEDADMSNKDQPKDKFGIVRILFFMLGIVQYLPWTFFITATGYWQYKFRNTSSEIVDPHDRTDLQAFFTSSLSITIETASVLFLTVSFFFAYKLSVEFVIIGSLFMLVSLFIVEAIFIKIDTDSWQIWFFAITLMVIIAINGIMSCLSFSILSSLACFPEAYLSLYLNGQGLANVFSATLQILSLTFGMTITNNALVYFGLGILVLVLIMCLVTYVALKNPFFKYNLTKRQTPGRQKMISLAECIRVFKKIWTCILVNLIWALTVIPVHTSVTGLVVSEGAGTSKWSDTYFVPVITYFMGALVTLIGKGLASVYIPDLSQTAWIIIAVGRLIVFVPLLLLCNEQPRQNLPVLFPHDYQYIIILVVYSLTNGYTYNVATRSLLKLIPEEELKPAYQLFAVTLGVLAALISFLTLASVKIL